MASQSNQPKGILKNVSAGREPPVDPRSLALQHANLLQNRKDIESEILDNLVLLSEYPLQRSPPHPASSPAPSDVASFKSLVRLFQPSDYDDLIEERNVNGLCGYSLCAKPRRRTGPGGEWKLSGEGIVKRKDIETWCSQQCAKRALFVKVQLNETAAWERAGIPDITIDLLDEGDQAEESEADRTARKLENLKLEDQRQAARDTMALALERGEPKWTRKKIQVTLKEKDPEAPPPLGEDTIPAEQDDHLLVEGHKTKLQEKSTKHA